MWVHLVAGFFFSFPLSFSLCRHSPAAREVAHHGDRIPRGSVPCMYFLGQWRCRPAIFSSSSPPPSASIQRKWGQGHHETPPPSPHAEREFSCRCLQEGTGRSPHCGCGCWSRIGQTLVRPDRARPRQQAGWMQRVEGAGADDGSSRRLQIERAQRRKSLRLRRSCRYCT